MWVPHDVGRVLDRALDRHPDSIALVARSRTLTYAALDSLANRASRAWQDLGIRRGDRVAVCLPNQTEIVVAFHGAMRLGAIWVGINSALAPPEKAYILRDSGASVVLCDPSTAAELEVVRKTLPALRAIIASGGSEPVADVWAAAIAAQDDSPLDIGLDPAAPAALAYTSGTTGYPKGAVHSQTNLLLPGAYLVATRRYNAELRKGDAFPLTILNMMALTTLLTSQAGATGVIMDSLSAREIATWIRQERVTVWNGPPALLYTMARDDEIVPSDLATLQEVWSGGADCAEEIRRAFERKFSARIFGTYGLTEAPTVVSIESFAEAHVPGSSGMPLPHMEVTIRDDNGEVVPTGEVGEICVGVREKTEIASRLKNDWGIDDGGELPQYSLMLGYWEKSDQSAQALHKGVLHTGDVGSLDESGCLRVTDRLNLVLNRGGANVYPAEVERVALGFDAVDACGVMGVPDARLGERIGMLVQFKPGVEPDLDAVVMHCSENLARYKVPELVAAVNQLPRNSMGKIDRRALVETAQRTFADPSQVRSTR